MTTDDLTIVDVTTVCDSDTQFYYEPALILSDGTISTPMGAGWYDSAEEALAQAREAIMTETGPCIPQ